MPIICYENLTHVELAGLVRDKTVVLIPVGPLEQHGPHLPLGTDAIIARFFSEKMAERLAASHPDWNFLMLPTIFAGSDTLTYTGSIEVRPATLRALLLDCCRQLAKDGFRTMIAVGTHGGPRHMVVLEEVAAKMRWRYRTRMISASARFLQDILLGDYVKRLAERMEKSGKALSADELAGLQRDYHAGMLETSIMMAIKPEYVSDGHKSLQPALVDSYWKLRRNSGKKVGAGLGYLGSPALARPEVGAAAIEVFLDDAVPMLERFLAGEKVDKLFRSKAYWIPFFRTDFSIMLMLLLYPVVIFLIWLIFSRALTEMVR